MFTTIIKKSYLPPQEGIQKIISEAQVEINKICKYSRCELTSVLFSSHPYNQSEHQQVLQQLKQAFPTIQLVGGSFVEHIISDHKKENNYEDSFTLLIFITDRIKIQAGYVEDISKQNKLNQEFEMVKGKIGTERLCIIFPGHIVDGKPTTCHHKNKQDGIIPAIRQAGITCTIVGGVCSAYWGDFRRNKTDVPQVKEVSYQYFNNQVFTKGMSYLIFYGPIGHNYGFGCAWEQHAFGDKYSIQLDGTKVISIDNQEPRKFLQQKYHPIVSENGERRALYVMQPFKIFKGRGHKTGFIDLYLKGDDILIFGNDVNIKEAKIQFTEKPTINSIELETSKATALKTDFPPTVMLMFSCCNRMILFENNQQQSYEYNKVAKDIPTIALYGFGEIGPESKNSETALHGSSVITLILMEGFKKDFLHSFATA